MRCSLGLLSEVPGFLEAVMMKLRCQYGAACLGPAFGMLRQEDGCELKTVSNKRKPKNPKTRYHRMKQPGRPLSVNPTWCSQPLLGRSLKTRLGCLRAGASWPRWAPGGVEQQSG